MAESIEIEIAYALTERQVLKSLHVPVGSSVDQAIRLSGMMDAFPEIDLDKNRLGIFSQFVDRKTILKPQDRIEIYRPLLIEPMEARRLRVSREKVK